LGGTHGSARVHTSLTATRRERTRNVWQRRKSEQRATNVHHGSNKSNINARSRMPCCQGTAAPQPYRPRSSPSAGRGCLEARGAPAGRTSAGSVPTGPSPARGPRCTRAIAGATAAAAADAHGASRPSLSVHTGPGVRQRPRAPRPFHRHRPNSKMASRMLPMATLPSSTSPSRAPREQRRRWARRRGGMPETSGLPRPRTPRLVQQRPCPTPLPLRTVHQ